MDIVYVVKHLELNHELRWSLRSLQNLDHNQVWISGFTPTWVANVRSIKVRPQATKHLSTTENLLAACRNPDVSDPFVLFNDDFFVLHPISEVPMLHRGLLADWVLGSTLVSSYKAGAVGTLQKLRELGFDNPVSYDLHTPLVVYKQQMIAAIEHSKDVRAAHKRTLYGNLAGIGGDLVADCKIYDQKTVPNDDWLFVSTSDGSFAGNVGRYLKQKFAEPHVYEEKSG